MKATGVPASCARWMTNSANVRSPIPTSSSSLLTTLLTNSKRASSSIFREQRKVVYNNMGWRSRALEFVPGPIKDFVSRVNFVAGSGIEDKRGKGRGQAFQKKETKKESKARKRQEELEQGGWGQYVN